MKHKPIVFLEKSEMNGSLYSTTLPYYVLMSGSHMEWPLNRASHSQTPIVMITTYCRTVTHDDDEL